MKRKLKDQSYLWISVQNSKLIIKDYSTVWKVKDLKSHKREGQVLFQEINDDFILGSWLTI